MRLTDSFKKQWNKIKIFEQVIVYLFACLSLLIIIFNQNAENWKYNILFNIIVILFIYFISPLIDEKKNKYLHFIRYWYIIAALSFIYWYIGSFIHLVFPGFFDHYILSFEMSIFGVYPNLWVQDYVYPLLTEIMQISYCIYWLFIPVGAAIFYFNRNYDKLEYTLFYTLITFFVSYLFFILTPVAGPRFILEDQITVVYKGLLITPFLRNFVCDVGLYGGAFPSSHVAVAIVILLFLWKYYPSIAKRYFLPAVIALSLATFYGQYHYITDVIAGLILGLIFGLMGIKYAERKKT